MEWLKDKKNQTLVTIVAIVVVVGAVVAILFMTGVFGGGGGDTSAQAPTPPGSASAPGGPPNPQMARGMSPGAPGMAPGAPGMHPGAPGMAPGAPGMAPGGPMGARLGARPGGPPGAPGPAGAPGAPAAPKAAASPQGPHRPDPFVIPVRPGTVAASRPAGKPLLREKLPPMRIAKYGEVTMGPNPQAVGADLKARLFENEVQKANARNFPYRVAGIINASGYSAILDNGKTVQPGDIIDGVGQVISIQKDSMTVQLVGDKGLVQVPVSSTAPSGGGAGSQPGTSPGPFSSGPTDNG